MTTATWINPAYKAHNTRRIMARKRSDAARKAHVTRGRKGRSAAACKAWRTRRAQDGGAVLAMDPSKF